MTMNDRSVLLRPHAQQLVDRYSERKAEMEISREDHSAIAIGAARTCLEA